MELVEDSLANFRKLVEREKQNGLAEIEERALVLRETTRNRDKIAKQLDQCIVSQEGRKRCNVDRVSQSVWSIKNRSKSYIDLLDAQSFLNSFEGVDGVLRKSVGEGLLFLCFIPFLWPSFFDALVCIYKLHFKKSAENYLSRQIFL
jgi:hypothetical protein